MHCFFSGTYLVTVHRDSCPPFEDLRRRATVEMQPPAQGVMLLYMVVDVLADSFLPGLTKLDDRIDDLENGVLQRPDDEQLQELFRLKRRLVGWRKVISPERDTFARIVTGVVKIPGMTPDMERYFRDVYDHLIRISDLIDSYRDLLTGAMDVYLSTVSNRLNEVMKRLTIVATIFMPLTFIVGLLRHELHLDGQGDHRLLAVLLAGRGLRGGGGDRHAHRVPPPEVALRRGGRRLPRLHAHTSNAALAAEQTASVTSEASGPNDPPVSHPSPGSVERSQPGMA